MVLNLDQFAEHTDERGFIFGQGARQIFRKANIRMWTPYSAPHLGRSEGNIVYEPDWRTGETEVEHIDPSETLHSAQQHVHGPTLARLLAEERGPVDHPVQVYESRRGHRWIEEGHHRLLASRLRDLTEEAEIGREH